MLSVHLINIQVELEFLEAPSLRGTFASARLSVCSHRLQSAFDNLIHSTPFYTVIRFIGSVSTHKRDHDKLKKC